jgi:hypothetical protein
MDRFAVAVCFGQWNPSPSGGVLDWFIGLFKIIVRFLCLSTGDQVRPLDVTLRCKRLALFAHGQNATYLEISRLGQYRASGTVLAWTWGADGRGAPCHCRYYMKAPTG